jgi:hypothetical protein
VRRALPLRGEVGRVFQKDQHVEGAGGEQQCGDVQRAPPAKLLRRPASDHEGERATELITGSDDSDGRPALQRGKPVRRHPHGRRPAQGLHITVARPDDREEIESRGPAKKNVQRRRGEQADREQHAWRPLFGELAVDELANPISQLERHQHSAQLPLRVSQFLLNAGQRYAEIIAAKIKGAIGEPQDPQHNSLGGGKAGGTRAKNRGIQVPTGNRKSVPESTPPERPAPQA